MNDLVDMRDWWKRTFAFGGPTRTTLFTVPHTIIRIANDTATALVRGNVLQLDSTLTGSDYWESTWPPILNGVLPTRGNKNIAVLCEAAPAKVGTTKAVAVAQLGGIALVKVNVGATWHRRARPTASSHVLTSGLFGPCEILSALSTTGEQLVLCSVGHADNRGVFCKTTSTISAAVLTSGRLTLGSGTAKVHDPYSTATQYDDSTNELTVYNMAGEEVATAWYGRLEPTDDWLPLVVQEPCVAPE